jgi:RNA polymerase sigma-70 factor (ECF subfamily)
MVPAFVGPCWRGWGSGVASRREVVAAEIPRLRRYARALTGDDSEADDLIQDTLERALARLDQWRDGANPCHWLFSILHNLHIDGLRRRSRRPLHLGLESVGADQSAAAADAVSGCDVDRALQLLSGQQREVLLLVGVQGLTYAEAANVLSIPIGTVMSRLARGRDRLRELMDEERPHGIDKSPTKGRLLGRLRPGRARGYADQRQ